MRVLIAALVASICWPAQPAVLTAGDLRVSFVGEHEAFIGALEDTGARLTFRPAEPAITFILELRVNGEPRSLQASEATCTVVRERDRLTHTYRFDDPGVTVVTEAAVVAGAIEFTARVDADGPGVTLGALEYPVLDRMGRPGGDRPLDYVLYPYASGRRFVPRDPAYTFGGGHIWPSAYCTMQWWAYCLQEGRSLYLTTPDPAMYAKAMRYRPDRADFRLGLIHYPEGMYATRSYRTPYPLRLSVIAGDWYDCARQYRRWALEQPWARGLRYRHDLPERVRGNVWSQLDNGNVGREGTDEIEIAVARDLGVPMISHMYMWHQRIWRMDILYPEFIPPHPWIPGVVARMQAADIPVMPYVNARLWDRNSPTWAEQGAEAAALHSERGEYYNECGDEQRLLTAMDPTVPLWQDTIAEVCRALFEEVGCRGIYLDQIAAAPPRLDFSAGRDHPSGGGTWWVRGYEEMLAKIHALMPAGSGRFLSTESLAETYQRQHALYLTSAGGRDFVPAFETVYGETILEFGGSYDFDDLPRFRLQMAADLLFGLMPGWHWLGGGDRGFRPGMLAEGREAHREFAHRIAHVRAADVHMFSLSEKLRSPQVSGDNPVMPVTEADGPLFARLAVQAGAYRSEDGRVGVCLVNCDEAPHRVSVAFPEPTTSVYAITAPDVEPQPVALTDGLLTVEVPAATPVLYVTRPAG